MDTKAILHTKRKLNELAAQHNRLTTLCAFLLNEVSTLKKEMSNMKTDDNNQGSFSNVRTNNNDNSSGRNSNFSELKAEEILKQLSINNTDISM